MKIVNQQIKTNKFHKKIRREFLKFEKELEIICSRFIFPSIGKGNKSEAEKVNLETILNQMISIFSQGLIKKYNIKGKIYSQLSFWSEDIGIFNIDLSIPSGSNLYSYFNINTIPSEVEEEK